MSEVFASINHRLAEQYQQIDLPSLEAKERYAKTHVSLQFPPLIFSTLSFGGAQVIS